MSVGATRWDYTVSIDEQMSGYQNGVQARGSGFDISYLLAAIGLPFAIGFGLAIDWKRRLLGASAFGASPNRRLS